MNLTIEQIGELKGGKAVRVSAPEVGADCWLIRADLFARLGELIEEAEDKQLQEAWLQASQKSAVAWMKENPY